MIELGHVDICCEVSMLSSHISLLRGMYISQMIYIFRYLKTHHNEEMVFYPLYLDIYSSWFEIQYLTHSSYGKLKEYLPPYIPEPCGMGFTIKVYVNSNHARE